MSRKRLLAPSRSRAELTKLALLALAATILLTRESTAIGAPTLPQTADLVIFARGDALWTTSTEGDDPKLLLDLPFQAAEVETLHLSSQGQALLLRGKGFVAWSSLKDRTKTKLRFLPCSGPSNISADGTRVVCGTQDEKRIAIYTLLPTLAVRIIDRKAAGPLAFAEAPSEIVSFGDNDDVIALSSEGQRILSSHRPNERMLVTSDGRRALGAYEEESINVVYTFRLDARATKRTLVHAARAIATSADSKWGAIQQEVDACAVRLAGGQYMCWRDYKALAISSQGKSLLLSRAANGKRNLYLGSVSGTRSREPMPLATDVEVAAAFWPRGPSDSKSKE